MRRHSSVDLRLATGFVEYSSSAVSLRCKFMADHHCYNSVASSTRSVPGGKAHASSAGDSCQLQRPLLADVG